jgi:hypothetical protein
MKGENNLWSIPLWSIITAVLSSFYRVMTLENR